MALPIPATKFFLPPPPLHMLSRACLRERLLAGWQSGARLTLVSAPAGYGKTSLMSDFIQSAGIEAAWVGLDRDDNDPARFLACLIQAVRTRRESFGAEALALLRSTQLPDLEGPLVMLINEMANWQEPLLLALDDYHILDALAVHALLQKLLDRQPPGLRLALLTREDPPLALARLRARQQLVELRTRDLRFDLEETGALLRQGMAVDLDPAQLASLQERTEGWCAGVQLAGLSLQQGRDPAEFLRAFSGTHRYVIDYLVEEVLDRLDPALRDFLQRTAILDAFCAPLCDAVMESGDSAERLAQVEAANLFLIPLDESRSWFRYHHLFADILCAGLPAETQAALQRKAAAWLAANDRPADAIRYALAGQDYDLAVEHIARLALPAAFNGQMSTVTGWMDALPEEQLLAAPELSVYRTWMLAFTGRFAEARNWIDTLGRIQPDALPVQARGLLLGLRAWLQQVATGKIDVAGMRQAYDLIGGENMRLRSLLLLGLGQAERQSGNLLGAAECFREACQLAERENDLANLLTTRNNLAFLLNDLGRLQEGLSMAREGVARHTNPRGEAELLAGIPLIALGCLLYEAGEFDQARETLLRSLLLVRQMRMYEILAGPAEFVLVQIHIRQGRLDAALEMIERSLQHARKVGLNATIPMLEASRARAQLAAGDLAGAAAWAEGAAGLPDELPFDPIRMVAAHVLAASGQARRALALLEGIHRRAIDIGRVQMRLHVTLEQAHAYLQSGEDARALERVREAILLAAPQGYRQVFGCLGPAGRPLLTRLRSLAPAFVDALLAAEPAAADSARLEGNLALVEPLSERELELLDLLAQGLSNQQIAARLFLTVGTVKWYFNNIYGKLGVRSRTQAVAAARALKILA